MGVGTGVGVGVGFGVGTGVGTGVGRGVGGGGSGSLLHEQTSSKAAAAINEQYFCISGVFYTGETQSAKLRVPSYKARPMIAP